MDPKLELFQEAQVLLSKERTVLSFMRTGLAFIATGIVIAEFFKDTAAYVVGYILVGIGFVEFFESVRRLLMKQKEMRELKKTLDSM